MAKRFIDTGLFDDSWFMELSKDGKLFWIYLLTKCNHAGIIEKNERLFIFQTGINKIETVIKELGNRLVSISDKYYLIPKFFKFQYPQFPEKSFKAAESAYNCLLQHGVDLNKLNTYLTLNEVLHNTYGNGNGNGNGNGESQKTNNVVYSEFYDAEILIATNEHYLQFVKFLFGENDLERKLSKVLGWKDQIKAKRFDVLLKLAQEHGKKLREVVLNMEASKYKYDSFNLALTKWIKNEIR